MVESSQSDFMYYSRMLKGNYKKGEYILRQILATPKQAESFISNAGAVSVIFGGKGVVLDKNANTLFNILATSEYFNKAIETWLLAFCHGFTCADDILQSAETCEKLLLSPAVQATINSSQWWLSKLIAGAANVDYVQYATVTQVAADSALMQIIADNKNVVTGIGNSVTAVNAIAANVSAAAIIANSDTAMTVLVNNKTALTSLLTHNAGAREQFLISDIAMTKIAASGNAMDVVVANTAIIQGIMDTIPALEKICDSSTAITKIVANSASMNAFVTRTNSAYALNLVCKNNSTADAFASGAQTPAYFSNIIIKLNDTKYFTRVVNGSSFSCAVTNTDYYINGAVYIDRNTTVLTSDDCFVLVSAVSRVSNGNYGQVQSLAGAYPKGLTGSSSSITNTAWDTVNYVIPRGIRYRNANISGVHVYKAL